MNLDSRTMMVMMSALILLFSALLTLAGLHAGNTRGVHHWAMGGLCMGLGLSFSYPQQELPGSSWVLVIGATLAATGIGLQFNGIQSFKTGYCNRYIPYFLAGLVFIQSIWFVVLHPDVHGRVVANSLVFALCNAACARALFIRIEQPLRTAYWFTGASFAVVATMLLLRSAVVFLSPAHSYSLYSQAPINPATFFYWQHGANVPGFRLRTDAQLPACRGPSKAGIKRRADRSAESTEPGTGSCPPVGAMRPYRRWTGHHDDRCGSFQVHQ